MAKLYILTSLLAVSFFSYAQYRGMSIYTGGGAAQQLARGSSGSSGFGSSGWSRSSSLSHK